MITDQKTQKHMLFFLLVHEIFSLVFTIADMFIMFFLT